MSRILVAGIGPLPDPKQRHVFAPGLRLLSFLRSLRNDGHELALVEAPFNPDGAPSKSAVPMPLLEHAAVAAEPAEFRAAINRISTQRNIEAVVATSDVAALGAATSSFPGPLYVDYYGHPLAERQQQAAEANNNAALAKAWEYVLPVLLRADRFSACSQAQRLALLGELGAAGRLNAQTCGHDLVDVIPPVLAIHEELPPSRAGFLRERGIPAGAPVILSTGGFNNWFDEETLFGGLQKVMMADHEIHFAATGGEIPGAVVDVFRRFRDRVRSSAFADRVHLLGWLEHDDFLAACREAWVAVVCDHPTLEGELGARTRTIGWLWSGLRVVCTESGENVRALSDARWIRTVRPRDTSALADALRAELALGRRGEAEAESLRREVRRRFSEEELFLPVVRWARRPRVAHDREHTGKVQNPLADWQRFVLAERNRVEELEGQLAAAIELADRLEGSRLFNSFFGGRPEIMGALARIRSLRKVVPPSSDAVKPPPHES